MAAAGIPLALVHDGSTVKVTGLHGSEEMRHHLETIGFVEGAQVQVVTQAQGQVIVTVKGSRFGLNKATAKNVFVEEL